ncbi:hypothetical protein HDA32_001800 [Spinactinospora alkalitolerans]|uniref:Uncharacterized protein n=1 Tax=Spinactinospora alkalitolerans TaxID=687207 RepID=A0A852TXV0_9ACTN|nr:hypothetical protein [Spinactinospora alkalitolerans]NYE46680.1 hypothetical protein [Spinactinospora alkalitolerans]
MAVTGVRRLYTNLVEFIQQPTMSGQLRRQVLFYAPLPLPVFALLALAVGGQWSSPGWTILLSASVAVASLLLAFVVQPTPLPEGLSAEASVRRSLHRFRQITGLRIGLAMTPIAVGAGAALAGGGLFPFVAALLLAWPQLLLAVPSFWTVSRARRSMESWGTQAYIWAALAQPVRVEWPLLTRVAAWRRARAEARGAGAAKAAEDGAVAAGTGGTGAGESVPDGGDTADPAPDAAGTAAADGSKGRSESLIPGLNAGSASATPRPSRPILHPRTNTRPKARGDHPRSRPKAKNQ